MEDLQEFLARTYFENTILDYFIALAVIIVGIALVQAFKRIILTRIKGWTRNTRTHIDTYVIGSIEKFGLPAIYFAIFYVAISYLTLSPRLDRILQIATTAAITFMFVRFVSTTILLVLRSYLQRQPNGEERVKQLGGIMLIINILIWAIGLLFLFSNMGYDVSAVIAGLGIGGIAVALAAQNILGDLFNYFVIFLDRPFEIGDFVIIDDKMGVIENIGIKTTRIKSISGEQLVFSNSDLTNSRIHNYKRMQRRRVLFRIGVIYQTSYENLRKIPEVLKAIVQEQQKVEFDRAHFAAYGDSSLDFEIVYYVLDANFAVYMDVQQAINFRIFEEFKKLGVDFAYPTRTLFISNEAKEEGSNISSNQGGTFGSAGNA